ncbi:arsenical pump-driving ATPase [Tessaracoccus rhinocerotis]|uniref:Arsenical pump-driving ATPase n=1 Tax=Tessaracoccus rhinocerotis TaxID=1689449 RepID=A0A553JWW9_9ACTN|nr:arsenical pump-driving ATPase [Tessaracoccus rhinocerotis]TRY16942.1 arsenical pump-driving ATPase [Tessaracoccus rhinocerotis]
MPSFITDAPRYLFLTGKGGVGKTSVAAAAALILARGGRSVLLVSTDPASNVGQVFGLSIGNTITPVPAVPGLSALEIDPDEAADAYREQIIGPVRNLLPQAEIAVITEQLSGACTTEIASFNEFTGLLTDAAASADFDHIVFDTAPTGHTIRLLQLPGSWTDFLNEGKGDASCLGPLAGLDQQRGIYAEAVAALANPELTRLVLVTRAQRAAMDEVERTSLELAALGMSEQYLVINAVMPEPASDDELATAVHRREQDVLRDLPAAIRDLPTDVLELKSDNMVGIDALGSLLVSGPGTGADTDGALGEAPVVFADDGGDRIEALVDELAEQDHGLVMLMGKGGVGKTTVAAAIAVALAGRGLPVHLTTTDPAAHLDETLDGGLENLTVSRIDPHEATQQYRDNVMRTKGAGLDEAGRAALAEDLMSPCTEEIAVFQAFSRAVSQARRQFVVIDTAPTGHTLLLLDATGSYHRDVVRQMGETAYITTPMMRLQDPDLTKVIVVTLPEATPVLEAEQLQSDLRRAGILPWAWVVNNSLAAAHTTDALLRRRGHNELAHIRTVAGIAPRHAIIPLLEREPVGVAALGALTASPDLAGV